MNVLFECPKISLSLHRSVNYKTKIAAKLCRHLVSVVTVAKAKHLEFGLADYADVFMMLSACLSGSQWYVIESPSALLSLSLKK